MEGEADQVVVCAGGRAFELGRQLAVDVDAPVGGDAVLDGGPHRLVGEAVLVGLAGGLDDLCGHGLVGAGQQAVGRDLPGAGHHVEGELGPDDRSHPQELAGAGVHPGQATGDSRVTDSGRVRGSTHGRSGLTWRGLGEEEGVAFGPQPDRVDHVGRGQDAADGVAGDAFEHVVAGVAVAGEVGEEGCHRVGRSTDVSQ